MADLSNLIKNRGIIKQQITKICSFFAVDRSATQAEIKQAKLDKLYKEFDYVQSAIEEINSKADDPDEGAQVRTEAENERDHIDNQYDQITAIIKQILKNQEQEDIERRLESTPFASAVDVETNEIALLREQVRQLTLQNQNFTAHLPPAPVMQSSVQQTQTNHRRIKLTKFDPTQPQIWLSQIEMTLELEGFTSEEEKFKQVFINLEGDCLTASEDLIGDTTVTNKFSVFKKRILSRFAESAESKLRRLLKGADAKDQKPSVMLAEMRRLAGGECGPKVLRECFMQTLPELTRNVLTVFENYSLDDLATAADKMYDSTTNNHPNTSSQLSAFEQHSIQAVSQDSHLSYTELCRTVKDLSEQLQELTKENRYRSKSKNKFPQRLRSSSQNKQKLCFYHRKWAHKAKKCEGPCSFDSNNQEN